MDASPESVHTEGRLKKKKEKESYGEEEMRSIDLAGELGEYIAQNGELNKGSGS